MRRATLSGLLAILAVAMVSLQKRPRASIGVPPSLRAAIPFRLPPVYPRSHDADRAVELLDSALAKVAEVPDPRQPLTELLQAAVILDPAIGCDRIRATALGQSKRDYSPRQRNLFGDLANAVAPWDSKLRDELLALAIGDGYRALADESLWKERREGPGWCAGTSRLQEYGKVALQFRNLYQRIPRRGTVFEAGWFDAVPCAQLVQRFSCRRGRWRARGGSPVGRTCR